MATLCYGKDEPLIYMAVRYHVKEEGNLRKIAHALVRLDMREKALDVVRANPIFCEAIEDEIVISTIISGRDPNGRAEWPRRAILMYVEWLCYSNQVAMVLKFLSKYRFTKWHSAKMFMNAVIGLNFGLARTILLDMGLDSEEWRSTAVRQFGCIFDARDWRQHPLETREETVLIVEFLSDCGFSYAEIASASVSHVHAFSVLQGLPTDWVEVLCHNRWNREMMLTFLRRGLVDWPSIKERAPEVSGRSPQKAALADYAFGAGLENADESCERERGCFEFTRISLDRATTVGISRAVECAKVCAEPRFLQVIVEKYGCSWEEILDVAYRLKASSAILEYIRDRAIEPPRKKAKP